MTHAQVGNIAPVKQPQFMLITPEPSTISSTASTVYVTDEEKHTHAYQYHGYPALSEWMASSNDFYVLRKFATVSARTLLYLQDEIAQLEKELGQLDEQTRMEEMGKGMSGSFKRDRHNRRGEIMRQMPGRLNTYCTYVARTTVMLANPLQMIWLVRSAR